MSKENRTNDNVKNILKKLASHLQNRKGGIDTKQSTNKTSHKKHKNTTKPDEKPPKKGKPVDGVVGSISKKKTAENENKVFKNIIQQMEKEGVIENSTRKKLMDEIDGCKLSTEQEVVLELAKTGINIFLTGVGGTGKSYLLNKIIRSLKEEHGSDAVFVTASTGIAAVNIGGCTVHSFSGIGNGEDSVDDILTKIRRIEDTHNRWLNAKVLVIDEISMLSGAIFTKLNEIAKDIRNDMRPFGGIQVIVCGDFFQLPPVTKKDEKIDFCFKSNAWREVIQRNCELTFSFRQKGDSTFLNILNQIRTNTLDSDNEKLLMTRLKSNIKNYSEGKYVTLFPYKDDVKKKNTIEYEKIDGQEETYTWKPSGIANVESVEWCNACKTISLKKGCQVMLIKNLDFGSGLVNGSVGVVVSFAEKTKYPIVRFTNGVKREMVAEDFVLKIGEITVATIVQIPLILSSAVTIHKSQGMTIDFAEMALAKVFEYHQAYVALSRCTSLAGLVLLSFNKKNIKVHPDVVRFYKDFNKTF